MVFPIVIIFIQAVLTVMGVGTSSSNTFVKDLPLFIAFVVLAIFTFVSGLRAPALIAFIKDTLVYLMVIVAVFYIPIRLGGWGHIFGVAQTHSASINPATKKPYRTFIPTSKSVGSTRLDFATLALGSALALFIYPHSVTGTLAAKRRSVVKRNMAFLPLYSVLLALIGYMAIADKTTVVNVKKAGGNSQLAVPYLFQHMFPSWFTGIAFSGIIIGALVPAAIMSIAAVNLFTRWFDRWALLTGWLAGMVFGTLAAYKSASPPRRTGLHPPTSSSATRSTSASPRRSSTSSSR
jgi:SSS family solute:Na+ symporter